MSRENGDNNFDNFNSTTTFHELARNSLMLDYGHDRQQDEEQSIEQQINILREKHPDAFRGSGLSSSACGRLAQKIASLRSALIVVDFQNDFVDGSLSIKNGPAGEDPEEAIGPLNCLLQKSDSFGNVFYTLDWHPPNHISFVDHCRDPDRQLAPEFAAKTEFSIGELVRFERPPLEQALYPSHCVQGTWGAELHSGLHQANRAEYIRKGHLPFSESYSGFVDNQGENRTQLEPLLRASMVDALFICGLASDVCVAATARDAAKLGFLTAVVTDCSKGLSREGIERTRQELADLGVAMLTSKQLVEQFPDRPTERRIPWQWLGALMEAENGA